MKIFFGILAVISLIGTLAEKDTRVSRNMLIAFCVIIAGLVVLSLAPMML